MIPMFMESVALLANLDTLRKSWLEIRQGKKAKELDIIIDKVKKIEAETITKSNLLEIISNNSVTSSRRQLTSEIFNITLTDQHANRYLKRRNNLVGHNESINTTEIEFNVTDLCFSSFGTPGYMKKLKDGKTILIFHSAGNEQGRFFAVQWGIGHYYREFLGVSSFLGFPTSNEYSTEIYGRKGARSNFEGGYIEYVPEYDQLQIYRTGMKGDVLVLTHSF